MTLLRSASLATAVVTLAACQQDVTAPPPIVPLTPGAAVTVSGRSGSERIFTVEVPEGTGTFRLRMTGGSGDADILVKHGSEPGSGGYDCVSEAIETEEECIFNLPSAGTWYVLVYGYTAFSGASLKATLLSQSGWTTLTSGVPVNALSGAEDSFQMFAISVPVGTDSLKVSFTADGDADLYVRQTSFPLLQDYDCASYTNTGTESCRILTPSGGTWYVRVDGWAAYTNGTLTATLYDAAPPP